MKDLAVFFIHMLWILILANNVQKLFGFTWKGISLFLLEVMHLFNMENNLVRIFVAKPLVFFLSYQPL